MKRRSLLCFLTAGALLQTSLYGIRESRAWCQIPVSYDPDYGGMWYDTSVVKNIPVYLNVNVAQHCDAYVGYFPNGRGGLSDCDSFQDIESTTRVALDELGDTAGANVRFIYYGATTEPPGTVLEGAIHIYAEDTDGIMSAVPRDDDGDNALESCRIKTKIRTAFQSYQDQTSTNQSWHGVLLHELLHCLGFGHTDDAPSGCVQTQISVMDGGTRNKSHYFKDDILGAQIVYGTRSTTTPKMITSSDGANWTWGPAPPSGMERVLSRYSLSNWTAYETYGSFPRDYGGSTKRLRMMKMEAGSWTYLGQRTSDVKSFYHTATAGHGFNVVDAIFQRDYVDTTGQTTLYKVESSDSGQTWASPQTLFADTSMPGASATYDPATGQTFVAFRVYGNAPYPAEYEAGQVATTTFGGTNNYIVHKLRFAGDPLWSADSPSIACGPTSVLGQDNCMLTWTTTQWDRFFYWVTGHFELVDNTWEFKFDDADVYAHPAMVAGQANVAYTTDPDWPWVVTYHQGSYWVYTMRKSVSGAWTNLRAHYAYSYTTTPAVGSVWGICFLGNCPPPEIEVVWHGSY